MMRYKDFIGVKIFQVFLLQAISHSQREREGGREGERGRE